ncbi:MAG: PAS domain-containing sensor histidine kinase [Saprospiraceae bacterium]|nr:PAS domain-containing sensor histidine kinase [Saprospiraceae bacterium]
MGLRLKAVIETATDCIITISSRGIIESVNDAVVKLFGYSTEELIGQNISVLMPEPDRSNHNQYIDNYLETRKAKIIGIGREVEGLHKNGTRFPARLSVSEVVLNDRTIFTGILHDLSQQKQAEQEIRKLNTQLEARVEERTTELEIAISRLLQTNQKLEHEIQVRKNAEEALQKSKEEINKALHAEKELGALKSRFVSMASHEFRTPLSSILTSVELIELYSQSESHPKREKHIERIKSAVTNLTSILNDFLSLSKLEEGNIQLNPVELPIYAFCQKINNELKPTFKTGQELLLSKAAEELIIFQDPKVLKLIFSNLLSNASKYSPENSTIHCNISYTDSTLSIEIMDQGIGIPEEDQMHLFTRFFRAHNVENIQGTGLGLNIVKQYVDLLEGTIRFESKLGKGTTFWLEIPLKMAERTDY